MRQKKQLAHRNIGLFYIISCIFFGWLQVPFANSDVVIITNKSVTKERISKDKIRDVFLGKIVKWDDGSKINIAVFDKQNELHKEFVKEYTQKSTSQFEKWWRKMVFTGQGTMPKSFESDEAIIEYIKSTEGAVGYIEKDKSTKDDIMVIVIEQ